MCLILGVGACFDVRSHRIPNWWVLFGLVSGVVLEFLKPEHAKTLLGLSAGSFGFLLRAAAGSAVFFLFFLCRMIGAGDIKLAGLICAYLGWKAGAAAIGLGFLIGAFWSLLKMLRKDSFFKRFSYLLAYVRQTIQTGKPERYYNYAQDGYEAVIPLGLCLFLGTAAYLAFFH